MPICIECFKNGVMVKCDCPIKEFPMGEKDWRGRELKFFYTDHCIHLCPYI